MSKHAEARSRRGGFTLPEILVAVAMVGVLGAVTLPAVMNQVNKSEVSRVIQDIQNIGQASQLYRADVGSWPATTDELISSTASGWAGPYLARTATGTIVTGTGASISTTLDQDPPTGATADFLEITVTGLTNSDAIAIDTQIDAGFTGNWWETGVVQATGSGADFITYYPVVIK